MVTGAGPLPTCRARHKSFRGVSLAPVPFLTQPRPCPEAVTFQLPCPSTGARDTCSPSPRLPLLPARPTATDINGFLLLRDRGDTYIFLSLNISTKTKTSFDTPVSYLTLSSIYSTPGSSRHAFHAQSPCSFSRPNTGGCAHSQTDVCAHIHT